MSWNLRRGRRQFVEIVQNFPSECQYVLEMLGRVHGYDAEAREQQLRRTARLEFHQQHSGPVMEELPALCAVGLELPAPPEEETLAHLQSSLRGLG